jgi:hypothetical protein
MSGYCCKAAQQARYEVLGRADATRRRCAGRAWR